MKTREQIIENAYEAIDLLNKLIPAMVKLAEKHKWDEVIQCAQSVASLAGCISVIEDIIDA